MKVRAKEWLDVERKPDATLHVRASCTECGGVHEYFVAEDAFVAWLSGLVIQQAFPLLPKEERELLISGQCGPCFDLIAAVDSEEDEERWGPSIDA